MRKVAIVSTGLMAFCIFLLMPKPAIAENIYLKTLTTLCMKSPFFAPKNADELNEADCVIQNPRIILLHKKTILTLSDMENKITAELWGDSPITAAERKYVAENLRTRWTYKSNLDVLADFNMFIEVHPSINRENIFQTAALNALIAGDQFGQSSGPFPKRVSIWPNIENISEDELPQDEARVLDKNIGYIHFGWNISLEEADRVEHFLTNHPSLKTLIIDLRGNFGGYDIAALRVASIFLPPHLELLAAQRRSNSGTEWETGTYKSFTKDFTDYKIPLIIIVDHWTMSAPELLISMLKSHDRAIIVGERTFGKAMGQQSGEDGLGYSRTIFYSLRSKTSWHGTGIEPDIKLTLTSSATKKLQQRFPSINHLSDLPEYMPLPASLLSLPGSDDSSFEQKEPDLQYWQAPSLSGLHSWVQEEEAEALSKSLDDPPLFIAQELAAKLF